MIKARSIRGCEKSVDTAKLQLDVFFICNSPYRHILCITADMSDNTLFMKFDSRAFVIRFGDFYFFSFRINRR